MAISPEVTEEARQICADKGDVCTGPEWHIQLPDGSVGPHAWVAEGIHRAASRAAE